MARKKNTKSQLALLRDVEKEMAKPRVTESVRRAAVVEPAPRASRKR